MRPRRRMPILYAVGAVAIGCSLSLLVSLWQTLALYQQDQASMHRRPLYQLGDFILTRHGKRPVLPSDMRIGSLSCDAYGGPAYEIAQEMVYWQEISSDRVYRSPFYNDTVLSSPPGKPAAKYLTFQPDGGGWNNIR
jgi:hypothetical protein